MKIPYTKYQEFTQIISGDIIPVWLAEAARRAWDLDLSGRPVAGTVLVRPESPFGYGRASYELNLGCNYDCEHCYLGLKKFEGLSWLDRERLLHIMRDARLPLALSMIVTKRNAHEVDQMRAIAERLALPFDEYVNMVPTSLTRSSS